MAHAMGRRAHGATSSTAGKPASAWSPLRQPVFRALWTAGVVSNIGTWMQSVGGAWFMTSLSRSAVLVALMQTATSLPVLLVGIPAGALADILDRRRLLLVTQTWMLLAAAALSMLTFWGAATAWLLLALTFALGLGAALNTPAWQAITPEIVSRETLTAAVTLSGVSVNIARAVGPAFGGLVLAAAGPAWVFLLNALSFLGVIVVVYRWRRLSEPSRLPPEDLVEATRAGWRYVRHSPALRAVLVRAAVFVGSAAALWALMPLVARNQLGLDSTGYGVLYGSLGVGALLGAMVLPAVRRRLSLDALVGTATCIFALATLVMGCVPVPAIVGVSMVGAGAAWMALMSSLNVAALTGAPRWVQARSVAVYMVVFQGVMAGASVAWGAVAQRLGSPVALALAAVGLVVGWLATQRWHLAADGDMDLSPAGYWAEPIVATPPRLDEGPVLVMIEYRIDPTKSDEFARAMHAVLRGRRRDGAIRAGLWRDPADPARYVETFVVESWVGHLRQHERLTVADRAAHQAARLFHIGECPPAISHLLADAHVE